MKLTKQQWIEAYGGQELLDSENLEVVPCDCDDLCKGWRVVRKLDELELYLESLRRQSIERDRLNSTIKSLAI